jgi:hypothetical protein
MYQYLLTYAPRYDWFVALLINTSAHQQTRRACFHTPQVQLTQATNEQMSALAFIAEGEPRKTLDL